MIFWGALDFYNVTFTYLPRVHYNVANANRGATMNAIHVHIYYLIELHVAQTRWFKDMYRFVPTIFKL